MINVGTGGGFVLGIDPGLASCGWAIVHVYPDYEEVMDLGVIVTEKSDKKRKVLSADDNLRRAFEVVGALEEIMGSVVVSTLCAESMSFPRSSSAAAKMAMTWGILATMASQQEIPILQASPQEIKKKLCDRKNASKEEIEEAVKNRYAIEKHLSKIKPALQNHACDAVAAVVTCLDSDVIKFMRKVAK